MRRIAAWLLASALWVPATLAGNTEDSTTTLTIDPSATAGTTITAADENDRSNDSSTWANAHVHSLANTTSVGDGAAGTKNLCFDAADATDMCIRFDDTNNMLLIDSPVAGTFGQILKATGTAGLTDGGVLVGGGTGEITALAVMTNGQLLIGDGTTAPTLATLTQGTGITITNGAGSITIAASGATVADRVYRTAGDVTTTSTSLVDFTGASITLTTGANPVLAGFIGNCNNSGAGSEAVFNVDVDGTDEIGTSGIQMTDRKSVV